jgi:hypothetical protein
LAVLAEEALAEAAGSGGATSEDSARFPSFDAEQAANAAPAASKPARRHMRLFIEMRRVFMVCLRVPLKGARAMGRSETNYDVARALLTRVRLLSSR